MTETYTVKQILFALRNEYLKINEDLKNLENYFEPKKISIISFI